MIRRLGGPSANGPYSLATVAEKMVFLAGQLGFDPDSGLLVGPGVVEQTRQALTNIANILAVLDLGLDSLVSVTCYLVDIDDWAAMNEAYSEFLGDVRPARTAIGGISLPMGARIEITATAHSTD